MDKTFNLITRFSLFLLFSWFLYLYYLSESDKTSEKDKSRQGQFQSQTFSVNEKAIKEMFEEKKRKQMLLDKSGVAIYVSKEELDLSTTLDVQNKLEKEKTYILNLMLIDIAEVGEDIEVILKNEDSVVFSYIPIYFRLTVDKSIQSKIKSLEVPKNVFGGDFSRLTVNALLKIKNIKSVQLKSFNDAYSKDNFSYGKKETAGSYVVGDLIDFSIIE